MPKRKVVRPMFRGIVPMLIRFGAPTTKFFKISPESLAMLVGIFLSESSYLGLNKAQLRILRRYLKKHGYEDWTRRIDEPRERDSVIEDARSRKNRRKS